LFFVLTCAASFYLPSAGPSGVPVQLHSACPVQAPAVCLCSFILLAQCRPQRCVSNTDRPGLGSEPLLEVGTVKPKEEHSHFLEGVKEVTYHLFVLERLQGLPIDPPLPCPSPRHPEPEQREGTHWRAVCCG
jgi:hypothetical protein